MPNEKHEVSRTPEGKPCVHGAWNADGSCCTCGASGTAPWYRAARPDPASASPRKQQVIEQLCKMMGRVWAVIDPDAHEPCDCVCDQKLTSYQNAGHALTFMEYAISEAIARRGRASASPLTSAEQWVAWQMELVKVTSERNELQARLDLLNKSDATIETCAKVVDKQASVHRMRAQAFADDSDRADGGAQGDDIECEEQAAELLEYVATRVRALALRTSEARPEGKMPANPAARARAAAVLQRELAGATVRWPHDLRAPRTADPKPIGSCDHSTQDYELVCTVCHVVRTRASDEALLARERVSLPMSEEAQNIVSAIVAENMPKATTTTRLGKASPCDVEIGDVVEVLIGMRKGAIGVVDSRVPSDPPFVRFAVLFLDESKSWPYMPVELRVVEKRRSEGGKPRECLTPWCVRPGEHAASACADEHGRQHWPGGPKEEGPNEDDHRAEMVRLGLVKACVVRDCTEMPMPSWAICAKHRKEYWAEPAGRNASLGESK